MSHARQVDAVDLGDRAYWLVVISMMTGFVLGALGLLLGIGALIHRHASTGIWDRLVRPGAPPEVW